jgi:dTDP-4-dehydrorhamnose reductase
MKILVTGAVGMLGIDLMERLGRGHEPVGVDLAHRTSANPDVPGLIPDNFDILDEADIRSRVASIKPDWVIHCAAYTNVDGCEKEPDKAYTVNADGAVNVAKACWGAGAKMLYVSTDYVYDGKKREPYVETDPAGPLNVYGSSKLRGETGVLGVLPGALVVRTSWLFGLNGPNFIEAILGQVGKKDELDVVSDQVGSPTCTQDLADALARLIEVDASGVVHVSNEGMCSWHGFAVKVLELAGAGNIKVNPITTEKLGRPALRPAYSVLSKDKYAGITGHRLRRWEDAVADYICRRSGR